MAREDEHELIERYKKILNSLESLKSDIEIHIKEICYEIDKISNIDKITCRVKTLESFLKKANKLDDNNRLKYQKPFIEIQDLIGCKIVMYYKTDVEKAADILMGHFRRIEKEKIIPDDPKMFHYEGLHFIFAIPLQILNKYKSIPDIPVFFELQILTLFQHAWATTEHDIGYKPTDHIDDEILRKLAFIAAQAWGADKMLEEIIKSMDQGQNSNN